MAIHVKQSNDDEKMTCFIILDSLGLRETWAAAIRLRHDVGNKFTILRPGGIAAARLMSADDAYSNVMQQPPSTWPPTIVTRARAKNCGD